MMAENLRHRLWMVALSAVTELIAGPIAILFAVSGIEKNEYYERSLSQAILHFISDTYAGMLVVIAVVGAAIVAIGGFSYLLHPGATDLYHSVPVKREKHFTAIYLNGLLIWAVPLVLCWLTVMILGAVFIPEEYLSHVFRYCFSDLALATLAFLLTYHLFLVCTMLSGNVLCALLSSGILGTVVVACWGTYYLLMQAFTFSFAEAGEELQYLLWMSPLAAPFGILMSYTDGNTWSNVLQHLSFTLAGSILMIALLLFLAIRLYKVRKSEQATSGLNSMLVQLLISIPVGFLCGAVLARFIVEIRYSMAILFWEIFCCLLGSFLSVLLLNLSFLRSFRAVWKRKLRLILIPVGTLIIYLIFRAGLIPYDNVIPRQENIVSAHVARIYPFAENGYSTSYYDTGVYEYDNRYVVPIEDPALIEQIIREGVAYNKLRRELGVTPYLGGYNSIDDSIIEASNGDGSFRYYATVEIKVERRFGGIFTRTYSLPESSLESIRAIVESRAYQEKMYPLATGRLDLPDYVEADWYDAAADTWRYIEIQPRQIADVIGAYRRDFSLHNTLEELDTETESIGDETEDPEIHIQLELRYESEDNGWNDGYNYITIPLSFTETNTLVDEICREYIRENIEYYQGDDSYYQ